MICGAFPFSVCRGRPSRGRAAGFTLIELLVVIGLIALLAGGLGFALSDTGGNSLATAQNTIASLVGSARAQAAVHQASARVYVYGLRPPNGDADKFLRLLQVFREEPAGSGNFTAVGDAVYLPRGVYVVPPSTTGLLASGVVWPTANPDLRSTFATPQPQALRPALPAGAAFGGAVTGYYLEFAADGTLAPSIQPYARLVVSTATLANNLPQFNNPAAVRGVLLRPSGALTFASDPASF
jgi:prepilin-type N-terminal cleavage/methylation domain-containing protein